MACIAMVCIALETWKETQLWPESYGPYNHSLYSHGHLEGNVEERRAVEEDDALQQLRVVRLPNIRGGFEKIKNKNAPPRRPLRLQPSDSIRAPRIRRRRAPKRLPKTELPSPKMASTARLRFCACAGYGPSAVGRTILSSFYIGSTSASPTACPLRGMPM